MNANANEADQRKKYSDKQLLSNILAFAKPYWKLFLFSLLLTAFIVMAGLAQPYIIKVAIDQHINGIYAPMVYVNQADKDQALHALEERGVKGKEITTFKDHTYFRLNDAKTEMPRNFQKARIVSIEGSNYLIHGWNTGIKNPDALQISNNHISINDNLYPVTSLKGDTEQLFRSQDYTGLIWLGILYFVLIIGSSVLTYFQNNTLQFTGQSVIYDIRKTIMRHLSQMQISFYDKNPIGRLVTRITHDVEALNQLYSQVIVNLIREILMLIGIIIIMLQMSVKLTLISFTVIPFIGLLTFYFKKIIRNAQRYVRLVLSKLNAYLAENLSGMHIIQIFAREEKQLQQFDELNQEHYKAGMRQLFSIPFLILQSVSLVIFRWLYLFGMEVGMYWMVP